MELPEAIAAPEPEIVASVEILPAEQSTADYLANLARCTMVLLAYEAQPYKALTSGVFTEAASLGKPVVVPAGTWMAEKIAEGYGVGMAFEGPAAASVAEVILQALRSADQLGATAREIAPRLGEETGCRRFIERMMAIGRRPSGHGATLSDRGRDRFQRCARLALLHADGVGGNRILGRLDDWPPGRAGAAPRA